jgi:hypothetical protein
VEANLEEDHHKGEDAIGVEAPNNLEDQGAH